MTQELIMTMLEACLLMPNEKIALKYSIDSFGYPGEGTFYCDKAFFDDGIRSIRCGQTLAECPIYNGMFEKLTMASQIRQLNSNGKKREYRTQISVGLKKSNHNSMIDFLENQGSLSEQFEEQRWQQR